MKSLSTYLNEARMLTPSVQSKPEDTEYIVFLWRPNVSKESTSCHFYKTKEDALAFLVANLGTMNGPGKDTDDADDPKNKWIVDAVENIQPGETVYFKKNNAYLMRLAGQKFKTV